MSSLLDRLNRLSTQTEVGPAEDSPDAPLLSAGDLPAADTATDSFYTLKHALMDEIVDAVDERAVANGDQDRLRLQIEDMLARKNLGDGSAIDRSTKGRLTGELINELLGYGPIDPYLSDPTVSRITVNGPDDVYVERLNRLDKVDVRFRDDEHILELGKRIAAQLNAKLDAGTPMLDRKLGSEGKVRVVIPPLARKGPTITINKGLKNPFLQNAEEKRVREMEREDPFVRLKLQIMERVVRDIDPDVAASNDLDRLRTQVENQVDSMVGEYGAVVSRSERTQVVQEVLNEMKGLGPLEPLLSDPNVSEVMVNAFNMVFVEKKGKLELSEVKFRDDQHVLQTIEKIVAPLGRRIDEASPMVDARLKDGPAAGSRVNAIIPPLALKGPCLTIRKFSADPFSINDLINFGTITPEGAQFLDACVKARLNIVVSGGTGSGKTTLLNVLSGFIPPDERIVTVEDAAELQLRQPHVVTLETRPANVEGKGQVTIRDLVKNTLRMRPDRIVVGECRGGEALDMLQAMNTGHEGSLTTLHANTPRDGLARLETMVLMAGMELPLAAIREQIASAVDIIVQQTRFACGTRLVTHICEVSGMESGKIQLQELFRFANKGYAAQANGLAKVQGLFTGCDVVPHFYDELRASGHALDLDIFRPGAESADLHAGERP